MTRRARTFALILAAALASRAGAQPPAAGQAEAPRPSLVRGELVESRMLGVANCSPDPNAICQDVLIEARVEIVQHLAGPHLPQRTTIRYIAHIPFGVGSRIWLLILPERHAYRPAFPLRATNGGHGRETCFDAGSLAYFGAAPVGGTPAGENCCYRR